MNLQRQSNPKMVYQDIVVAVTGAKEYGEHLLRTGEYRKNQRKRKMLAKSNK